MCLVFIDFHPDRENPLRLGANREEAYRRPTTSAVCCRSRAGRCLLAGADHGPDGAFPGMGTWLGVNGSGLVVAVTNRSDGHLRWEEQTRSRGLLAVELLGCEAAGEAARLAGDELARGGFGGTNYVIADAGSAIVVEAPGMMDVRVRPLSPGVHAVTNLDMDDPDDRRVRLVRERLDAGRFEATARALCRDPEILIEGGDRGTVSSTILAIGPAIRFHHLLGNPRRGVYNEYELECRR